MTMSEVSMEEQVIVDLADHVYSYPLFRIFLPMLTHATAEDGDLQKFVQGEAEEVQGEVFNLLTSYTDPKEQLIVAFSIMEVCLGVSGAAMSLQIEDDFIEDTWEETKASLIALLDKETEEDTDGEEETSSE